MTYTKRPKTKEIIMIDEPPETIFNRVIKSCNKWDWNKVMHPPVRTGNKKKRISDLDVCLYSGVDL